jgi:hypothetical protein
MAAVAQADLAHLIQVDLAQPSPGLVDLDPRLAAPSQVMVQQVATRPTVRLTQRGALALLAGLNMVVQAALHSGQEAEGAAAKGS